MAEIRNSSEIGYIRKACEITDEIFSVIVVKLKKEQKEGKDNQTVLRSEKNIEALILDEMMKRGVKPSFPPIIASGKHAANPHHVPVNRKLLPGFCVIDFGVRYKGYCSDMTRTVFFGRPSRKQKALYSRLLSVQKKAVKNALPGKIAKELDSESRKDLGNLSNLFIHSLGHQVGRNVHTYLRHAINKKGNFKLKKNMAITIEPGIYRKGRFGIRIEDTIIVSNPPKILTQSRKSLIII